MSRAPVPDAPPSSLLLFRIWLAIGLQSFGGGVATLALIRQAVVDRHRWLTPEEFVRDWAVAKICPGMNLLAITILAGKRIAGWRGIFLCLLGLLFPSVTVTILLTAFYAHIQDAPMVKAALRGVVPASVGLGLLTSYEMAMPLLKTSRREGKFWLVLALLVLVMSGLVLLLFKASVAVILVTASVLSALAYGWRGPAPVPEKEPVTEEEEPKP